MIEALKQKLDYYHISYRFDVGTNKQTKAKIKRLTMIDGYSLVEHQDTPVLIAPADGIKIESLEVAFIKCCLHYKKIDGKEK